MSGVSRGDSNPACAGADSTSENIDLQSRPDLSGSPSQTVSNDDTRSRAVPPGTPALIISHPSLSSSTNPEGLSAQTENSLAPRLDSSESMTRAEIEHRLAGQDEKLTMILSLLQSGHNPSSSQSRTASTSGEGTTLASSLNLSDDKPETDVNFHGSGQEGKSRERIDFGESLSESQQPKLQDWLKKSGAAKVDLVPKDNIDNKCITWSLNVATVLSKSKCSWAGIVGHKAFINIVQNLCFMDIHEYYQQQAATGRDEPLSKVGSKTAEKEYQYRMKRAKGFVIHWQCLIRDWIMYLLKNYKHDARYKDQITEITKRREHELVGRDSIRLVQTVLQSLITHQALEEYAHEIAR